jgi:small subunit ribosomal protein S9
MVVNSTGKRKTSIARVFLDPKGKQFIVNGKDVKEYFTRSAHVEDVMKPLVATDKVGQFGIVVDVYGGGLSGQAGAIRHGVTKALLEVDETLRTILKPLGLITRDSRVVERKKPGKVKSRRSPQFSKR